MTAESNASLISEKIGSNLAGSTSHGTNYKLFEKNVIRGSVSTRTMHSKCHVIIKNMLTRGMKGFELTVLRFVGSCDDR
jgi:hypothetical protein